ncbi:MAG TPA: hypothetical protein VGA41_09670 [Candidatus Dormibacteraeota bacterium]
MDREAAEKIVRRDLPGVIKEMLKRLPFKAPDGLARQVYETSFEGMVAALLDGTIPLASDGRLTSELVEATGTVTLKLRDSNGNMTTPR